MLENYSGMEVPVESIPIVKNLSNLYNTVTFLRLAQITPSLSSPQSLDYRPSQNIGLSFTYSANCSDV